MRGNDWRTALREGAANAALGALLLIGLALLAVIAARGATAPMPVATLPMLVTSTATPAPTAGWWSTPVLTPPPMGSLPALPTVALSAAAGPGQGAPVAFQVLSCPRTDVRIDQITGGARRGWWNISGTAAIPGQSYWKGEISADGQGWQMLYRAEQPVQGGLLIEFNTRTVPAGAYQVRLTAVDRTGNYPEPCLIEVTIE